MDSNDGTRTGWVVEAPPGTRFESEIAPWKDGVAILRRSTAAPESELHVDLFAEPGLNVGKVGPIEGDGAAFLERFEGFTVLLYTADERIIVQRIGEESDSEPLTASGFVIANGTPLAFEVEDDVGYLFFAEEVGGSPDTGHAVGLVSCTTPPEP
ncbi:MAG: hypothetical protein AAGF12_10165 [Myxococcota bacterium]